MAIDMENVLKLRLVCMRMRKKGRHHRGGVQARLLTAQARAFFFFLFFFSELWFKVLILALSIKKLNVFSKLRIY